MKAIAAFRGDKKPKLVDAPEISPPHDGQVLCRTLQVGICGTDREILLSKAPHTPAESDFLILGHECLARVEACGAGVSKVRVGDLVAPVVRRPFERFRCERPDMLAFGRFSERGIYEEHGFTPPTFLDLPEHLYVVDPRLASVAVLTEPFSVAEKAVNEALAVQRGRLGDKVWTDPPPRVLVTGLGPIGFAALAVAVCRGWPATICGRDADDSFRARLAQDFGATYLPRDRADWKPPDVEKDGFDLLLECTGSEEVMIEASGAIASRGVIVWLGSSRIPEPITLNVARTMRDGILRNHLHLGTVNAAPRDFEAALADLAQLWRSHRGPLERIITERVAPADSLWHYENRTPQGIKTVLVY
jgi:threonine dehydrogenase-like Zn-dependent dehydrogenase